MVKCNKVNIKLTDTQQKKMKNAVENKAGITLRMNFKMFAGNDLPHEFINKTKNEVKKCIY